MDYTAIVKELMLVLASLGMGVSSCGCFIPLTGAGEVAIGMRNTNEVYIRSTVDGDKMGKTSQAGVQLNPKVWEWINKDKPDEPTSEDSSGDPDGDGPSGPDSDSG
jgi:hypothetical protein